MNVAAAFSYPGARWWKVEFHCHTPASSDYGKGATQAALKSTTPRDWLLGYMRAGLDCVVVTDHNSGAWIDDLKQAEHDLQSEVDYRPLTIYPGVELSVNGGVHLLAILDPLKGGADIQHLLGAVGYNGAPGSSDDVTEKSLVDAVHAVHEAGGLAIPAHVDQLSGALTVILDGNSLRQLFQCQEIVAAELFDTSFQKPSLYQELNTRWSEVIGSDSHHPGGAAGQRFPGSHFTWVKMGQPTLEGLRLALLDGAPLSILRSDMSPGDPNRHPDNFIEEIQIKDARYCGRGVPFLLKFNPWLNSLIGGRGTGKSTSVEFLRAALGRDDELFGKLDEVFKEFLRQPRGREDEGALTATTEITVVYRKDTGRYRLRWTAASKSSVIEEEQEDGSWVGTVGDVKQRFPVRIFSQKQIFSLSEGGEGLVRVVDESSEVDRNEWDVRWSEEEQRFYSLRAKSRELQTQLEQEARIQGELQDVIRKIKLFEGTRNAEVLKNYQRCKQQHSQVEKFSEKLIEIEKELRVAVAQMVPGNFDGTLFNPEDANEKEVLELANTTAEQIGQIQKEALGLAGEIEEARARWDTAVAKSAWTQFHDNILGQYQALVDQLRGQGVEDPTQYAALVQKRQDLEGQLQKLAEVQQSFNTVSNLASQSLSRLGQLRKELTDKRSSFLKRILQDNRHVHLDVIPFGRSARAFEGQFRELINRETGFESDILSADEEGGFAAQIYKDLPTDPTQAVVEFEDRLRRLKTSLISASNGDDVTEFGKRFCNFIAGLTPEMRDRIEAWYPNDSLNASYSPTGNGRDFRSIMQGSPGQRTAAMLAFLLAYGTEPMILDQPEDDLDNHLIYELIVSQLRENKRRRQLIVVTHNPNIVVNGDAELVIPLDFRSGQCRTQVQGSLQELAIREEVCRIMEGGRLAFAQRYRRLTEDGRNI